jgi:mRNA interferase RelE/StbE
MPELSWRKAAQKQLRAIANADDRKKLNEQVNELKKFPLVPPNLDITTLKNGQADYRLRWGSYRVLFNFRKDEEPQIIAIEEVLRRGSRTYK